MVMEVAVMGVATVVVQVGGLAVEMAEATEEVETEAARVAEAMVGAEAAEEMGAEGMVVAMVAA